MMHTFKKGFRILKINGKITVLKSVNKSGLKHYRVNGMQYIQELLRTVHYYPKQQMENQRNYILQKLIGLTKGAIIMLNRIDLEKMKEANEKISMITAYDYPSAKMSEAANVDMILVGDSLGMVTLGYSSTVQVTVNDMIHHGKAVKRGAPNTFVVVDMPFMSYHISLAESLTNARRIFQETDAQALKVEGASPEVLALTKHLTEAGIPVIAHLGLTPQTVNVLGGYKVQERSEEH